VHGKPSRIQVLGGRLFEGLPSTFEAGRYHSLHASRDRLPAALQVTAVSVVDGVIMAVEHRTLPVAGVQFHPESIMSLDRGVGLALVARVVAWAGARADATATI
jgi:anthranilate synthase